MPRKTVLCSVFVVLLFLSFGSGCSLVLDLQSCERDIDCSGGLSCSSDGFCTSVDTGGCEDDDCGYECERASDCEEGFVCAGDLTCQSSSSQCINDSDCAELFGEGGSCQDGVCAGVTALTGGPCTRLDGPVNDENAFLVGVVLQISGVGAGFGQPMLDSIRIAMNDINGIGGINGSPIGLVICDTEASNVQAQQAAEHLVEIGVTAIIGFNSSQILSIAPAVTIPNDVLVISPSATATTITNLEDNDLVWRTAQSDGAQGIAMAGLIEHVLDQIDSQIGLDAEDGTADRPAKLALLIRNQDQWATGLRDQLQELLPSEIVGGTEDRFTVHNFANVGAGEPADYTGTAADLAAEEVPPDVVVTLGSADSWTLIDFIDTLIESDPIFIGGDAMKNAVEASLADSSLEGRIWGTGPRNVAEIDYQPYSIFRLKFRAELNDEPNNYQFVANAFDALYVLAFAAAAEGFSGPELALGLTRLSEGQAIDPRASDAQQALQILSEGGTINYRGASGPINFDENGDPEPQPIALWCFRDGTVPEEGQLYSPADGFTPQTCQ